jgi:hypothetical protein
MTWIRAGRPRKRGSIPGKENKFFPYREASRPATGSGARQSPIQWLPVRFPRKENGRSVPRLQMSAAIFTLPFFDLPSCASTA